MVIMVNLPFNYEHLNQGGQLSFTNCETHTTGPDITVPGHSYAHNGQTITTLCF